MAAPAMADPATTPPDPPPDDNSDDELEATALAEVSQQPLHQGVIWKQAVTSRWFKPWTRRTVTVWPGTITWSKCAGHSHSMPLKGSTCNAVLGHPLRISVTFDSGAELVLQAENAASARTWALSIATAVGAPLPPQQAMPDFGDVAHDAEVRQLATQLANDQGAFCTTLFLRNPPGYFTGETWTECFGAVADGALSLFLDKRAVLPFWRNPLVNGTCSVEVAEREDCRTGHYCFCVLPSQKGCAPSVGGSLTLCATSSHEQLIWLQALVKAGARYADEPSGGQEVVSTGPTSFYELSAPDLDTGAEVKFDRFRGEVCLVVNVASK